MSNNCKIKASMNESKWKEMTFNAVAAGHNAAFSAYQTSEQIRRNQISGDFRSNMYKETNLYAKTHMRVVKQVVMQIRKNIYLFNQEIKFFSNAKEKVLRKINSIKKNIKISTDTLAMKNRDPLTSQKNDGTYDLVNAELSYLNSLYSQLLQIYKFVDEKLKDLHAMKEQLCRVMSERSVVLDLIVENSGRSGDLRPATTGNLLRTRDVSKMPNFSNNEDIKLGFKTDESKKVLQDSKIALEMSAVAKRSFEDQMKNFNQRNTSIQNAVNDGIFSKIVENKSLQDQLNLGIAQNRQATNRLLREEYRTKTSLNLLNGPFDYADVSVSDRLDRPIMRVLQRHPGTQVGEAQSLIWAVEHCKFGVNSLQEKNEDQVKKKISLLSEMRKKTSSIDQDSKLIRERVRKLNLN